MADGKINIKVNTSELDQAIIKLKDAESRLYRVRYLKFKAFSNSFMYALIGFILGVTIKASIVMGWL